MGDEVDLTICAEAFRDTFGEAIDFSYLSLHLPQISWLIERLMLHVLSVEVTLAINSPCELLAVIFDASCFFEVHDSDDLLVQFARSVVQTVQRTHIGLVDLVILDNFWIAQVSPVVAESDSLVRCPACEAVHKHDGVVVGPLLDREVLVATILVAARRHAV